MAAPLPPNKLANTSAKPIANKLQAVAAPLLAEAGQPKANYFASTVIWPGFLIAYGDPAAWL